MSGRLKPFTLSTAFSGDQHFSTFHFPEAIVEVHYGGSAGVLPVVHFTEPNPAAFAEIRVWSPMGRSIRAFPFSPQGFPLRLATLDQFISILQWAQAGANPPSRKKSPKPPNNPCPLPLLRP